MTNLHARTIEPQLQLSLLFFAVAEGTRLELQRRSIPIVEAPPEETYDFERKYEEPERWDGLL
jgi:hypothetical protein